MARPTKSGPNDGSNAASTTTFSAAEVRRLREAAGKASGIGDEGQDGWAKSDCDPMGILHAFPSLQIKPGFVMRAYVFRSGGNGNGVVWAMPDESEFPQPDDCPKLTNVFLEPPRPPEALDDLMEAVSGDDTALSYLSASILQRELAEFGARWHGCEWSTHEIVGSKPLHPARSGPSGPAIKWTWQQPQPKDWKPQVIQSSGSIKVVFYTVSGLGGERIVKHTDSFKPGSYSFETEAIDVASAPGGYVF